MDDYTIGEWAGNEVCVGFVGVRASCKSHSGVKMSERQWLNNVPAFVQITEENVS